MRHSLVSKKRSWFYSPLVAVALVAFIALSGLSVVRAYMKQREAVTMRDEYVRELSQMKDKESDLTRQIDTLSTERGLEAEIRERYRVVKPGEQLVIVVDNGSGAAGSSQQKLTFLQKIRNMLGW